MSDWKTLEPTEKQEAAIFNMRHALGMSGKALLEMPKTRGEASNEIKRLREVIVNNLSIGGSINPKHSVYGSDPMGDEYD